jgi:hypothetical protein
MTESSGLFYLLYFHELSLYINEVNVTKSQKYIRMSDYIPARCAILHISRRLNKFVLALDNMGDNIRKPVILINSLPNQMEESNE